MEVLPFRLPIISVPIGAVGVLLIGVAVSWFVSLHSFERRLTAPRLKPWLGAPGWWHVISGSLALWGLACGAAVIVLHSAARDLGSRAGAYRTGIATLVLIALAAAIIMRHRIARALPYGSRRDASHHNLQQNRPSHDFSHAVSISWSIKPKTWQRMHIAFAIGAMLPFWWHCDLGRASNADLVLKYAAILLLTSGFLGVAITDLTRWRLLSPGFSPRFSAGVIKAFFALHRGLALLTFMLISIHILVVLYFAGL